MPTIEEMLKIAKDAGASDVHITVGVPPKMRVNGKLITMDFDRLMPADTVLLLDEIMNDYQKECFEKNGEYDMSFSIIGQGRYRANAYKQRGVGSACPACCWNPCAFGGIAGAASLSH